MRNGVVLYLVVLGLFFVAGLVLLVSGIGLERADIWLDDHGDLFDAIGSRLLNVIWGGIFALCIFAVLGGLWQRFVAPRGRMGDAVDFVAETAAVDELGLDELNVAELGPRELGADENKPVGWGCMVGAAIVGYFAWFGMTG